MTLTAADATAAPFVPSGNITQLRESATIAASARAKALRAQGRPIIDLGAGEPDFDTPAFIRDAAKAALDAGATRYTATEGILPLREAIASRANALLPAGAAPVAAGDIVVGNGTKQALFNACFVLFGPGDDVLVPTPAWVSYYEMLGLSRANAVAVPGRLADGLLPDVDALARAATARTRGLMLNSPCNPTGAVYGRDQLAGILALAAERDWWVISDEIYRRIAYDGPAASAFEVAAQRDRLVVVDGVAKSYAMTGWRIGWAVAPRAVAQAIGNLQSHTTSNAATVSQHAALAALTRPAEAEPAIAAMVAEFRARRDACLALLAGGESPPAVHPAGAFYLFLDVSAAARGPDGAGAAFAATMLEQHDVAVVAGNAFGAPGWVRMSYAAPTADVLEGLRRIVSAWRTGRSSR
ncbi:MAG: aminotransferase class I/II-fold pyridoxal phosphate-dependent enzyme [Gemmatimonadetes bacterium]|nr:aminotransferase class I/II-fold pyridoxal phosphate-dependent enzyme [Gemmatimonadota bacterium]